MNKPSYDSGAFNWSLGSTVPAKTAPSEGATLPLPAEQPAGTEPTPEARGAMPVLVGCPRSGTTLLAVMLDSHPRIAMPPETAFLPELRRLAGKEGSELRGEFFALLTTDRWNVSNWNDIGLDKQEFWRRLCRLRTFSITGGLRVFYGMYAERLGKPLFGEKTPADTHCMPEIEGYLPEARFIHILRDPRDVVASLRRTTAGRSVERTAQIWVEMVSAARASAKRVGHYHEVRYEDLVLEPQSALSGVCDFLALDYASEMLDYRASGARHIGHLGDRAIPNGQGRVPRELRARLHENVVQPLKHERVQSWRGEMSEADRTAIEAIAGPLMGELGYDLAGR